MATSERDARHRRWTRAEYDQLVELGMFEGEHLELLDGCLIVGEPQYSPHASTVAQVGHVLETAFGPGWHARLHSPIVLDDVSEPEPDVAIVRGRPLDYFNEHPRDAALIVEVAVSSLRLDRRFKAGLYARAGLAEYWIVNLVDVVVDVHRDPQAVADAEYGARYRSVRRLDRTATISPLSAPYASIAVADLLPAVS